MAGEKRSGLKDLVTAESMVQAALALPIGCLVGYFLGHWLDGKLHTDPWIAVGGILLGAAGGFIQLVRVAKGSMKRGQ